MTGRPASGFVAEVVSGDRRRALEALRGQLAVAAVTVDPRYLAAVAKQLAEVLRELDELPVVKGALVDELADRAARRRRGEGTAGRDSAGAD